MCLPRQGPNYWALLALVSLGWLFVGSLRSVGSTAPTAIALSSSTVAENAAPWTIVGVLTAEDPDPGDGHAFSLVAGPGGDHNYGFAIYGDLLFVADEGPWRAHLDFENRQTFSIRVRATDFSGLTIDREFAIQMTDDRTEDADFDGLNEAVEEDVHGTSDVRYDTDGDGFGDSIEISKNSSPTDVYDWPIYPLVTWGDIRSGEPPPPVDAGFSGVSIAQQLTLGLKFDGTVAAWGGDNPHGQMTVPAGLEQVVTVAAGGDYWEHGLSHSLALKGDGTVVEWGYDDEGRLAVPAGLAGVVGIAAGRVHNLALKSDGTVVAWGRYFFRESTVPPGLSNVVAIAANGFYNMALKSDGTVVAWGDIFNGQTWEPASVPAGLCDVVAISAGRFHCLALKSDGTVVAWGNNDLGQATVPAGLEQVVAIAAGGFHSLALKDDGSVVGWGNNSNGQSTIPPAADGQIRAISAGLMHSLALRQAVDSPVITSSSRIISAPGLPIAHQLDVSHAIPSHFSAIGLPAGLFLDPQSGLISGEVVGAARRSIQILVDTDRGRLTQVLWLNVIEGLPPSGISLSPAAVMENSPTGSLVGTLAAIDPDGQESHTFELVSGSGSEDNGCFLISGNQLLVAGKIDRDFEEEPTDLSIRVRVRDSSLNSHELVINIQLLDDRQEDADHDGLTEAVEEDVHGTFDLAYDTDDDGFGDSFEVARGTSPGDTGEFPEGQILIAWGSDESGQATIPPGLGDIIGLAAGGSHNLVLKSDGTVAAWGANHYGQCAVPAGLDNVVAIAAGGRHSMALIGDGTVVAWGGNDLGQCSLPQRLSGVVAIAAGQDHSLALTGDGSVAAWGNDDYSQSFVPEGLSGVVAIAAGAYHSLALKSDGSVVAWGADWGGSVNWIDGNCTVAAGGFQSLALKSNGTVVVWGDYLASQMIVPHGLTDVVDLKAGWLHGAALKRNGNVVAWGSNANGQTAVPLETRDVRILAAGAFHNLALRQAAAFPNIVADGTVVGWPGQQVSHQVVVSGATPSHFSAMGLPAGFTIDPLTGLIRGTVVTGERRAARISVETDKGRLSRVLWFNTMDGVPPHGILLSAVPEADGPVSVRENSPEGTLVGTLTAMDSDVGDVHTFHVSVITSGVNSYSLKTSGNQLLVRSGADLDFESTKGHLAIRVWATDSALNSYEQDFEVQVIDDRTEDADGDGMDEAKEEDIFFTSDLEYDHFATTDADHDGVSSLVEYAFNLDLHAPDRGHYLGGPGSTSGLPIIYPIADGQGGWRLRIEYLRRIGSGLTYRPEFASGLDPADWAPGTDDEEVTPIDLEWERRVIDDDSPAPTPAARFGRVAVSH